MDTVQLLDGFGMRADETTGRAAAGNPGVMHSPAPAAMAAFPLMQDVTLAAAPAANLPATL